MQPCAATLQNPTLPTPPCHVSNAAFPCTQVEAAVAAAKAAPEPPMGALYEDIYTDQSKDFFMRGCDMGASHGVYGSPAFTPK